MKNLSNARIFRSIEVWFNDKHKDKLYDYLIEHSYVPRQ